MKERITHILLLSHFLHYNMDETFIYICTNNRGYCNFERRITNEKIFYMDDSNVYSDVLDF